MDEPWSEALRSGDVEGAWSAFVDRYRRLIVATIRHYVRDYDDVMDVFAAVCEGLRKEDLARLRRYATEPSHTAPFSTWLVAVVRNLVIDWFRHRDGRQRLSVTMRALPPLERLICEYVFLDGHSHVEAYELVRSREHPGLTFREFLKTLAATYRAVSAGRQGGLARDLAGAVAVPVEDVAVEDPPLGVAAGAPPIARALGQLTPDEQLAVQLFVLEELPATEVARLLGWRNAKAVYNRVYRALAEIRASLERQGIRREDL